MLAQALTRPGQPLKRVPEDREHGQVPADAIAIVRRAKRRCPDTPRLVYDSVEPALRALATLRELSQVDADRLFPL